MSHSIKIWERTYERRLNQLMPISLALCWKDLLSLGFVHSHFDDKILILWIA